MEVWELLKAVKKCNNSIFMQANRSVLFSPQNNLYTSSYTKISSKKCALISWSESSVTESTACILNAEQLGNFWAFTSAHLVNPKEKRLFRTIMFLKVLREMS